MLSPDERNYYLAFSAFEEGIGPMRFQLLLNYFKSAKNAWLGKLNELKEAGIPGAIAEKFINFRNKFSLEEYLKALSQKEISFVTLKDPDYPYLLSQISDAPIVLYIKGSLPSGGYANFGSASDSLAKREIDDSINSSSLAIDEASQNLVTHPPDNNYWLTDNKIAVVGTRTPTSYGKEITEILTQALAFSGLVVVSGMARGGGHGRASDCHGKWC